MPYTLHKFQIIHLNGFTEALLFIYFTLFYFLGILGKTWEGDEHRNDKKLFLTVLSRLKDGSDIDMR